MNHIKKFIQRMPKAEIHVHLEGTLEPEMRFRLAQRNRVPLPFKTAKEVADSYVFPDSNSFFAAYYDGFKVLAVEQDFYELTYAYLKRVHSQNVLYAEMMFDPQGHTERGVPFDTVIKGIHRAQGDAQEKLGIRSRLIMCFLRDMSAASAMEALQLSLPYKDWIVAVGLDSQEKDHPPVKFKEVFQKARAQGYKVTAHCGPDAPNGLEHIRQCLEEIKVDRIDHGVNAVEDDRLVGEIKDQGLYLTACPTSRKGMPGPRHAKNIVALINRGVGMTIGTDDPAYFLGQYMSEILISFQSVVSLSEKELVNLMANAFEAAWATQKEREGYLASLRAYTG